MLALLLAVVAIYAGRLLHDAVPSTIRAGVSSGAGTASWVLFLPFALALGWVGREQGVPRTGWLLTGAALLVGVLLVVSVGRARPVVEPAEAGHLPVDLALPGSWSTWSPTCSTASWRPGGARALRPTWPTVTGCTEYVRQIRATVEALGALPARPSTEARQIRLIYVDDVVR